MIGWDIKGGDSMRLFKKKQPAAAMLPDIMQNISRFAECDNARQRRQILEQIGRQQETMLQALKRATA